MKEIISAATFISLLKKYKGDMRQYKPLHPCIVNEQIAMHGRWKHEIHITGITFAEKFHFWAATFEKKVHISARFQKEVYCDHAVFKDVCETGNGTFLDLFSCHSATFKKGLDLRKTNFQKDFFCEEATFDGLFNAAGVIFRGDFHSGIAKFNARFHLGGSTEKTEFKGLVHASNHKHIAEQILYYKQGILI